MDFALDILGKLGTGFAVALTPMNIFYGMVGAVVGTAVGVLPGLGTVATIALLLPLTYHTEPVSAVIMLAGIFYGAQYGGSTTAILLNIPGEASSITTSLDGYQMARQGRAGPALGISALGSFIGGTLGVVGLCFLAPVLASFALRFGPPEYFCLIFVGLLMVIYLSGESLLRGGIMAALGLLLGVVGLDPVSGIQRFTFGIPELSDGIDAVAVAMGLFGISEVLLNLAKPEERDVLKSSLTGLLPTLDDWKRAWAPIARGSLLGFFTGILPGGGATISSFMSYGLEKWISRTPARFGNGAIEGVAGPESANNAAATSSFIPLMTLGIPGNAATAMILVALMIHGIQPGPTMMQDRPQMFWGLIASMYVGNVVLVALNLPLIRLWVLMLKTPYHYLVVVIIVICVVGAYTISYSPFAIAVMTAFGAFGFLARLHGFPPAPLILAMILGPLLEKSLQQTLIGEGGDLSVFITRPICAVILALGAVIVAKPLLEGFGGFLRTQSSNTKEKQT
jgi:putative tricarboxylic transport membrane protein